MFGDRSRLLRALIGAATAGLVCAGAPAQEPEVVATVLEASITRSQIAAETDDRPRAGKLLALIWDRVAPHYIASRGLKATDAEIAELAAYDRRFEAKDRSQRARKLDELDQRLRDQALGAGERARLQEFQATLRRLARYDTEREQEPAADPKRQAAAYAAWIELWKMNKALQEEYGGVVALTRFGPDPHGARAALLRDYEERGWLSIADSALRSEVQGLLAARPSAVIPPDRVDFTPYWKRPIPPSYFPD
jgi:hypothetical protein